MLKRVHPINLRRIRTDRNAVLMRRCRALNLLILR
jgi:hypothetical protein